MGIYLNENKLNLRILAYQQDGVSIYFLSVEYCPKILYIYHGMPIIAILQNCSGIQVHTEAVMIIWCNAENGSHEVGVLDWMNWNDCTLNLHGSICHRIRWVFMNQATIRVTRTVNT